MIYNPKVKDMTLRDWFAGQYFAILANSRLNGISLKEFAQIAYQMADNMIEARKND